MKCLVVGGGINGILTAYFLQKKGFNVDVLDAEKQVAQRATFANGCQLSFSHTIPMMIRPSFFSVPFSRNFCLKAEEIKWVGLHQKSKKQFNEKFETLMQSARFSKEAFVNLVNEHAELEKISHNLGTAFVFSSKKQMEVRVRHFEVQNEKYGVDFEALEVEDLPEIDHAFASAKNIGGGIFTKYDSTVDAKKLTQIMAEKFQNLGGRIFFETQVKEIVKNSNRVLGMETNKGIFEGYDEYIYCGGASGLHLVKDFGFNFWAVKGYSLTFDVSYSNHCPFVNVIDFTNKVVYSRHRDILRVAGFFDVSHNNSQKRIEKLHKVALERFPILKRQELIHTWNENRVFTPNEKPYVEKVLENFSINTAHGHLGVTLSIGSAKKITEILSSS